MSTIEKLPIFIHSFFTPDSSGGFLWWRDEQPARTFWATSGRDHEHEVLCVIELPASWTVGAVDEYIDAVLLDLIETRRIGRILETHDDAPLERYLDA